MFGTDVEISVIMRKAQNVCWKPVIGTDVLSDQISVPWLWLHFGILWRSETDVSIPQNGFILIIKQVYNGNAFKRMQILYSPRGCVEVLA